MEAAFNCRIVAYFHSEKGRADFTIPLDDPADKSHVISFSCRSPAATAAATDAAVAQRADIAQ
jgi:hypothetical protein